MPEERSRRQRRNRALNDLAAGTVAGLAAATALWVAPGYWSIPAALAAFLVTGRMTFGFLYGGQSDE